MQKKRAAIIGATGVAGQQFVEALWDHPWFEITGLFASKRSAGKTYGEAATWYSSTPLKSNIAAMNVELMEDVLGKIEEYDVLFSALPSDVAKEIEGKLAKHKPVISTASAYRYEKDVPVLVPELNASHIPLIDTQRKERGWKGFVVPGPNCTTMGMVISLKPLLDKFGLKNVYMTSLQALSGAGYPGVPSLDVVDNVIPYIDKEEDKVVIEAKNVLGSFRNGVVTDAAFGVSCTCTRVATIDGHLLAVTAETEKPCSPEGYKEAINEFNEASRKEFGELPSAPEFAIVVREEKNRPQPRMDRNLGGGMTTTVGRIRQDEILGEHGIKYICLSHNTKRGAAKGELLAAEYLSTKGYI